MASPDAGFWSRRLIGPIKGQIIQGVSPAALSKAIAAGFLCGIFPILGATTILATAAGIAGRLNQPVLQTINWLLYPLQLALIPIFIRFGEVLFGASPMPFSFPQLMEKFGNSPSAFFGEFGITMLHAIVGWAVAFPFLWFGLVSATQPFLQKAARRWLGGQ